MMGLCLGRCLLTLPHETAHLLHYLKPEHHGLHVRRGQERFVDVEFCHRELFVFACDAYSRVVLHNERKSRISFAEKTQEEASSFPRGQIEEVAILVLNAARARNGWRVIREATLPLLIEELYHDQMSALPSWS
jgi:hypothetical protein